MAGGDKGDDVCPDFRLAQALSSLRILSLHEEGEDVAGCARGIRCKPGPLGGNDGIDRRIEETQRRKPTRSVTYGSQKNNVRMKSAGLIGARLRRSILRYSAASE